MGSFCRNRGTDYVQQKKHITIPPNDKAPRRTLFSTLHAESPFVMMIPAERPSLYSRVAEMPTSGDLKSGDSLFFTTPQNFNGNLPPPPPRQIDQAPNRNDLGHYMKFYMRYILSKF